MDTRRRPTLVGLLLLFVMVGSAPALAQADFSGNWAPLFHEDHPERLPGPELGDYLGIPLNEAGRLRANPSTPTGILGGVQVSSAGRTEGTT